MAVRFPRVLDGKPLDEVGPDVEAVGRALARAGFLSGIAAFIDKTPAFRRTYNESKRRGVNRARAKTGREQNGVYDRRVHEYLVSLDAFDAYAAKLMLDYRPPPTLYFPIGGDAHASICQSLHETGGLEGNWAIDVCATPGAPIVAVQNGTIYRFSGSPPSADVDDPGGVFGYTTYFAAPGGYTYFVTHQGRRLPTLEIGTAVEAGDTIGFVGDQHFRPDHVHYGVSSPKGPADAKRRILAVAAAPRIR